jgi:pimeloyl-ACP methyl ester carboxylesterase
VAPNPEDWPALLGKVQQMDKAFEGWSPAAISSIEAPALVVVGDADIVRPEHAVAMLRLLGGGVPGDLGGLPGRSSRCCPAPRTSRWGTAPTGSRRRSPSSWMRPCRR